MPRGETSAQKWIDQGRKAYGQLRIAEAAQDFEEAVAIDPDSLQARLGLGALSVFLYANGISDAKQTWFASFGSGAIQDRARAMLSEQNTTNAKRAEESLQKALELDNRNILAMQYLGALYISWLDPEIGPYGRTHRSRIPDAARVYKRLIEIDPANKLANYAGGGVAFMSAFELLSASPKYPLGDSETRQLLGAQIGPILADSYRHLLRAIEIDPGHVYSMTYLGHVKRAQAYIANTPEERAS